MVQVAVDGASCLLRTDPKRCPSPYLGQASKQELAQERTVRHRSCRRVPMGGKVK